ncbi:Asp-tRNA(Asn)/Glu-tRNA(Gln) amidotransferase GatCAB subunit A [bacterium CG_4_10_14_0_2_um_filter_33_32]|nr:MAG: aspartyl/glutamyl-tRNA amidotransferase subunit A [bacterium CG2_30_33_46]PIU76406.1 MAG: Asp-tRNA(Asn)/Glu-tRNA(Gln) amidotransferase GatCAB subunit A [bacterium CG06_land_8_20_14_3_00_33_50]PIY85793.1 MAG: Asp-tRNA(Asn)/Glu-tRNA(Gln) amidotransferase GatCAB subunit A [bacterium CG_4_10_14_0_8_um_filter_33_57]PIZ85271.1 MAG: Asp-tRNA(Asn)/Glu-tRNA(Gln) amidotransferase GatCAB subunit A [bacterium CG_4_10_14_0_2_um_filter_33_32]PJA72508.1 MAG: Asp-tRNA(Asn)/Glu-tRNA(Gln) amidotransferas
MVNINELTVKEASDLLSKKEISSVDLTKACIERIEKTDDNLNAFITKDFDNALSQAEDSDKRRVKGETKGILDGIPCSIKDVITTKNLRTTAASKILDNFIPPYNSEVVTRLKKNGVVILGKNNCDAWAHGASTENSDYGSSHNPYNLERVPGGSSGGSAVSVASNQCIFSIGTDTGGSIRQPASFCNVVGLKPTYGRVSRLGLIAMASSLDVPGPITKTVEDSAIILEKIAGKDSKDSTTVDKLISKYFEELKKDIKDLKIGLPKEYFTEGMQEEVKKVMDNSVSILKDLGAKIVEISLPHTKYTVPAYYIIQPAEVSSNLGRYDGIRYGYSSPSAKNLEETYFKSRAEGFGDEAKRRIMLGTYTLSSGYYDAYYLKAMKVRALIKKDFDEVFNKVDAIITPVAPTTPFKIGEKSVDPLQMYLADVFTTGPSLAGIAGISVPAGFSFDNLPVGLQILSSHFNEGIILRIGHAFEQATKEESWRKIQTVV